MKHSLPEIEPHLPRSAWRLSREGRRRCGPLADRLKRCEPSCLYTSPEPKAVETARLVGERLELPVEVAEEMREQDDRDVPFLGEGAFEAAVRRFFEEPERAAFGPESANEAHARFARAVAQAREAHPGHSVAVVTHGRVLSLFAARAAGLDPFALWRRLGLPSVVVLSLPELTLLSVTESVV